jgi:hypothetical protein
MLAFLQVHEHHLQRQLKSTSAPSRTQSSPHVSSVFNRIECSYCHKLGHNTDQCYSLHPNLKPKFSPQPQSTSSLPGPPPRLECSYCHRVGHSKEDCYKLIGFPKGGLQTSRERSRSPSSSRQGARTNHISVPSARGSTPFSLTQD